MGLARFGIMNGQKVPVAGLLSGSLQPHFDSFTYAALRRLGFLQVAEEIIEGKRLDFNQLYFLVKEAGIPVLLKLVSLKHLPVEVSSRNRFIVPVNRWIQQGASAAQIDDWIHSVVLPDNNSLSEDSPSEFLIDALASDIFDPSFKSTCLSLMQLKPNSQLSGISLDSIVECFASIYGDCREEVEVALESLWQSGFRRLTATASADGIAIARSFGFKIDVVSNFDCISKHTEIAHEFNKLVMLCDVGEGADTWAPYITSNDLSYRYQGARDLQILRFLALGSLLIGDRVTVQLNRSLISSRAANFAKFVGVSEIASDILMQSPKVTLVNTINSRRSLP